MPVEGKALCPRLDMIRGKLSDLRRTLKVIQEAGDGELYGLALMEYALTLGELEPYTDNKGRYWND